MKTSSVSYNYENIFCRLTALHVAVHYKSMPMLLLLLEHKGNPQAAAKNGYTALHIAAKHGLQEAANTLLMHGAKHTVESKNGFTPLHLAAQEGYAELVDLLCRLGAHPNARSKVPSTCTWMTPHIFTKLEIYFIIKFIYFILLLNFIFILFYY